MKHTTLYILFVLLLVISCKPEQPSKRSSDSPTDTRQLVREANEAIGPMNITYTLNKERAALIKIEADKATGIQQANLLIQYALEMLNGGETVIALEVLDRIIKSCELNNIDLNNQMGTNLKKAVAIAYMRMGEQENCIQNHNHQSCIVPIQEDGIHTLTKGSTNAIKLLEDILSYNPNEQSCIWLLNLAHMTLGSYPEGVPNRFLLSPDYFDQSNTGFPRFDNIASALKIDDNRISGASVIEDFDQDGDYDIVATSWGISDQIHYYINDGNGGFEEKAKAKGLDGVIGGLNIKQTDYNNDGYIDLYIMRGAWMRWDGTIPNTLLKNNGDGSFSDVTIEAGLMTHTPTQATSWNDFNKDGWLDLIVVNESFDTLAFPTQLWINNKNGTFSDLGQRAGLTHTGYHKGVSVDDINNDGWPDIYVSALGDANLMYLHSGKLENGTPTFKDAAQFLNLTEPKIAFPNMIFDFNNDGNNDILVSSFRSKLNNPSADLSLNIKGKETGGKTLLYINKGGGKFEEISSEIGLTEAIYTMGCNYGDLDNDGWIDFYLATGNPSFFSIVPNKLYRNMNGKGVQDVTFASGMGHIQKGHGISMVDMDHDGDLDVYAVMGGAYEGDNFQNAYFDNPGFENHYVGIRLEGVRSNRKGIGARIVLTISENGEERKIWRTMNSGASFGANSLDMVIGIGKATIVKELQILWPIEGDNVQKLVNLEADKVYQIKEGNAEAQVVTTKPVKWNLHAGHHNH